MSSPLLLGFEEVERLLERVSKSSGEGYPPYNIERLPDEQSKGERIQISLAVAGFTSDQLEIVVENNQLIIRGKQPANEARNFLHRGIAARQFQRIFVLAEGIMVMGAELTHGLLNIDLIRPEPERIVRKIDIIDKD